MLTGLCCKTGTSVLRTGTGATRYLDRAQMDAAGIAREHRAVIPFGLPFPATK